MPNKVVTLKGVILTFPHLIERKKFNDKSPAKYSTGIYVGKKTSAGVIVGQILAALPESYRGKINNQQSPIKDGDKMSLSTTTGDLVKDVLGEGMWRLNPSAFTPKGANESNDIPLFVRDSATGKALPLDRDKDKEQLQNICYGGANVDVKVSFYDGNKRPGCELLGVCFNGFGEQLGNYVESPIGRSEDFDGVAQIDTVIDPEKIKQLPSGDGSNGNQNSAGMADIDDEVPF